MSLDELLEPRPEPTPASTPPPPPDRIVPSRQHLRDLFAEALAGMLQRPARSILTALGTVLGVGTFVAILGLTATATGQIGDRFNALTATEITVEDTGGQDAAVQPLMFTPDADQRVRALNGVEHAGVHWNIRLPAATTVRVEHFTHTTAEERHRPRGGVLRPGGRYVKLDYLPPVAWGLPRQAVDDCVNG
ncbi:ABC transporter permease [Embleya sp. NPDC055664]